MQNNSQNPAPHQTSSNVVSYPESTRQYLTSLNPDSVFISYRRDDTGDFSRRVGEQLNHSVGKNIAFFDTQNIAAGQDYTKVIKERIESSNHLFVVIGHDFLKEGKKGRLHEPNDMVAREIEYGLQKRKKNKDYLVIPILMGDAKMPQEKDLPPKLRELARLNAASVHSESLPNDLMGGLHEAINTHQKELAAKKQQPPSFQKLLSQGRTRQEASTKKTPSRTTDSSDYRHIEFRAKKEKKTVIKKSNPSGADHSTSSEQHFSQRAQNNTPNKQQPSSICVTGKSGNKESARRQQTNNPPQGAPIRLLPKGTSQNLTAGRGRDTTHGPIVYRDSGLSPKQLAHIHIIDGVPIKMKPTNRDKKRREHSIQSDRAKTKKRKNMAKQRKARRCR